MLASPGLPARGGGAAPVLVGRRGAAGRDRRALQAHFGVDIVDGIGSTEMLHIFLSNRPAGALRHHRLAGAGLRAARRRRQPVPDGEPATSTSRARARR
jgi:benzoate-CoA ligase